MPDHQLRTCPFSGDRTLVAGGRGARPHAWPKLPAIEQLDPAQDPFLEGHESQTPPELDADRAPGSQADQPGWQVRVVPNRFPLLTADAELPEPEAQPQLFGAAVAAGAHEVIVQSPRAHVSLAELDEAQLARVVAMWQRRLAAHAGAAARHLFVNDRPGAGATQLHTHAQLLVLPTVPAHLARERERADAYHQQTMGADLTADYLQEEVRRGDRIVAIDDEVVLLAPWASRSAFQLTLLPRTSALRFEDQPAGTGAAMLHRALRGFGTRFDGVPPFNLYLRTAVHGAERTSWRLELIPVLAQPGGVELGLQVPVCAVAPEQAAQELRDAC